MKAVRIGILITVLVPALLWASATDGVVNADLTKLREYVLQDEMSKAKDLCDQHGFVQATETSIWSRACEVIHDPRLQNTKRDDPWHVFLRATAAAILEMWDAAIQGYRDVIRTAGLGSNLGWACANDEAMCAARKKDYKQAIELFELMETAEEPTVQVAGRRRAQLIHQLMNSSRDVSFQIQFAKEFWTRNWLDFDSHYRGAIQTPRDALALNPTKGQLREIYPLIQSTAQAAGDTDAYREFSERLSEEFPVDDTTAQSLFAQSQSHFSKKEYAEAETLLRRIVDFGRGRWVAMAHLGLAEVYEKLVDDPKMLSELEAAASQPPIETHRDLMDASDTQQTALRRLGDYYKARGQTEKALDYFTKWRPTSWCGNGAAQFTWERDLAISECFLALGKTNDALNTHLMPHLTFDKGELYQDYKIPELVVAICERRGALKQLRTELAPHLASQYNHSAALADKLAQIRLWSMEGSISRLVNELRHRGGFVPDPSTDFIRASNWPAVAAAQALAEQGGKEVEALMQRFEDLISRFRARPDWSTAGQEEHGQRVWIIYALGVSKSSDALAYLKGLESQIPRNTDAAYNIGVGSQTLQYAISLHSPEPSKP